MNKNLLSLALGGLIASSAVAVPSFRNGLKNVGDHAHGNRHAYALIALAAFSKLAKDDIKKGVSKKSILSVGDKIVDLSPLLYAVVLGKLAGDENAYTKFKGSFTGFVKPWEGPQGSDKVGAFLNNGLTVFSTVGAAYAVGNWVNNNYIKKASA